MIRVNEDGSNAIKIDYFGRDFNRDALTAHFNRGLNFGPILFIMIYKSPLPSLPPGTLCRYRHEDEMRAESSPAGIRLLRLEWGRC